MIYSCFWKHLSKFWIGVFTLVFLLEMICLGFWIDIVEVKFVYNDSIGSLRSALYKAKVVYYYEPSVTVTDNA